MTLEPCEKDEHELYRTQTIQDDCEPKWNEEFKIKLHKVADRLRFTVWDDDTITRDDMVGCVDINCEDLVRNAGNVTEKTLNLVKEDGQEQGMLTVSFEFMPRGGNVALLTPSDNFLHGKLVIKIHHANNLPNADRYFLDSTASFIIQFNCCSAWFFSTTNQTDAYVQVYLEPLGLKLAETRIVDDNLNPSWKEVFHIMSCFDAEKIRVVVKDSDMSWTAAVMSICPSISF